MTPATRSSAPSGHAPAARRDLRRLAVELVGVVLVKIALLLLVYYAFFAPYPRPDTRPAAIERTLAPSSGS
ncbi:cytochrome oxidase putative small subunit CydP [Mizugakiibacter sediminis]|nr:cytochrome oxidase putative small subunit CydP [Mizugakiibacter sediminis]